MKDDYINYALATYMQTTDFDTQVGPSWIHDDSYLDIAHTTIIAAFQRHGVDINPQPYGDHFIDLFLHLKENDGVVYEGDEYSDQWFRFIPPSKNQALDQKLSANPVRGRILSLNTVGPDALRRALSKIADEHGAGSDTSDADDSSPKSETPDTAIPASDRIVTLSHNEIGELDQATTALVEVVEKENQIEGDASLRQRVLGQLKAGRELMRAGVFNAHLLQHTLMNLLGGLIEKYKGHAIGETAKQLWALLLKHVFTGS